MIASIFFHLSLNEEKMKHTLKQTLASAHLFTAELLRIVPRPRSLPAFQLQTLE